MKLSISSRALAGLAAASLSLGAAGAIAPQALAQDSTTPPAAVEAAPNQERTVSEGVFEWGVRDSWNSYITGKIAQGAVETSGGIKELPGETDRDRSFSFSAKDGEITEDGTVVLRVDGTLRFWGHKHRGDEQAILDNNFTNIRLEIKDNAATLRADVKFRPFVSVSEAAPFEEKKDAVVATWTIDAPLDTAAEEDTFRSVGENDGQGTLSEFAVYGPFAGMYEGAEYTSPITGAVSFKDAKKPAQPVPPAGPEGQEGQKDPEGQEDPKGPEGKEDPKAQGKTEDPKDQENTEEPKDQGDVEEPKAENKPEEKPSAPAPQQPAQPVAQQQPAPKGLANTGVSAVAPIVGMGALALAAGGAIVLAARKTRS